MLRDVSFTIERGECVAILGQNGSGKSTLVRLVRRYVWWELAFFLWTVANTLTIVFIAEGVEATGGQIDVERTTTILLIGAVIWAYLGMIFETLTETVAWERWRAPSSTRSWPRSPVRSISRHGPVRHRLWPRPVDAPLRRRRVLLRLVPAGGELRGGARCARRRIRLLRGDRDDDVGPPADLAGEGDTARLHRAGNPARVSGVYYPVSVLPEWMQWLATISPATYALEGTRDAILEGADLDDLWGALWPLLVIGAVSIPLGLEVFRLGERHAKRHGKLKRSG